MSRKTSMTYKVLSLAMCFLFIVTTVPTAAIAKDNVFAARSQQAEQEVKAQEQATAVAPASQAPTAKQMPAETMPIEKAPLVVETSPAVSVSNISIPTEFGRVIETYEAPNATKIVVHIQDLHTNYEAQMSEAKIIEALNKQYGIGLTMIEGMAGPYSLTFLRMFGPNEKRMKVADDFAREGKLMGAAYLDMTSDCNMDVVGLENKEMYDNHIRAFTVMEPIQEGARAEIDVIKAGLAKVKVQVYPKDILALEDTKDKYTAEKSSLMDYVGALEKLVAKNKVDLTSFPNFKLFVDGFKTEEKIDFAKVEDERTKLVDSLTKTGAKDVTKSLLDKSAQLRRGKINQSDYYAYLLSQAGQAANTAYPGLVGYVAYLRIFDKLNTSQLFKEIESINAKLNEIYLTEPVQVEVSKISSNLDLLLNAINIKLSPAKYAVLEANQAEIAPEKWAATINDLMAKHSLGNITAPVVLNGSNIAKIYNFYAKTAPRDQAFIANILKSMDERLVSNANMPKVAFVVAGGFHTEALKKNLKDNNISYIVISPKTTSKFDSSKYQTVLKSMWAPATTGMSVMANPQQPSTDLLAGRLDAAGAFVQVSAGEEEAVGAAVSEGIGNAIKQLIAVGENLQNHFQIRQDKNGNNFLWYSDAVAAAIYSALIKAGKADVIILGAAMPNLTQIDALSPIVNGQNVGLIGNAVVTALGANSDALADLVNHENEHLRGNDLDDALRNGEDVSGRAVLDALKNTALAGALQANVTNGIVNAVLTFNPAAIDTNVGTVVPVDAAEVIMALIKSNPTAVSYFAFTALTDAKKQEMIAKGIPEDRIAVGSTPAEALANAMKLIRNSIGNQALRIQYGDLGNTDYKVDALPSGVTLLPASLEDLIKEVLRALGATEAITGGLNASVKAILEIMKKA